MQNKVEITIPPVLFSEAFGVDKLALEKHGALDICLITDLPLFVDPFLLFNSDRDEYRKLHDEIIDYLRFLKAKSARGRVTAGELAAWYRFGEVKQTWLGFAATNNRGRGLGRDFAETLNANFSAVLGDYGNEQITAGSHLEKLCLLHSGVGRDTISDFTTNLIKEFILEYTEAFAKEYLEPKQCTSFAVQKAYFDYRTEVWASKRYYLPLHEGDFVLLVPRDILSRDDTWINRHDLVANFEELPPSIADEELRAAINNYFNKMLPEEPTAKQKAEAIHRTVSKFPELIDHFIKYKEDHGDKAVAISDYRVQSAESLFIEGFAKLAALLNDTTTFYESNAGSYEEALQRVLYLKHVIEDCDGFRYFYDHNGDPVRREQDLQIAYKLTWFKSSFDANREVNNGRGPVDFKVSKGSRDAALVEFKLASNSKLRQNLMNQVAVYEKASDTRYSIKVILHFTEDELHRVREILDDLELSGREEIVLIDARADNKPSASRA